MFFSVNLKSILLLNLVVLLKKLFIFLFIKKLFT